MYSLVRSYARKWSRNWEAAFCIRPAPVSCTVLPVVLLVISERHSPRGQSCTWWDRRAASEIIMTHLPKVCWKSREERKKNCNGGALMAWLSKPLTSTNVNMKRKREKVEKARQTIFRILLTTQGSRRLNVVVFAFCIRPAGRSALVALVLFRKTIEMVSNCLGKSYGGG